MINLYELAKGGPGSGRHKIGPNDELPIGTNVHLNNGYKGVVHSVEHGQNQYGGPIVVHKITKTHKYSQPKKKYVPLAKPVTHGVNYSFIEVEKSVNKDKPTEEQKEKVHRVMHEHKHGELHSGSKTGPIVKDRSQAVAIALSEAGLSKGESGKPKAKPKPKPGEKEEEKPIGTVLGKTKSGKKIWDKSDHEEHGEFGADDHLDSASLHVNKKHAIIKAAYDRTPAGEAPAMTQREKAQIAYHDQHAANHRNAALQTGAEMEQKPFGKAIIKELDILEKAIQSAGPGSRGGHVIGETRSGKAIYDTPHHESHKDFTKSDHFDAAAVHEKIGHDKMRWAMSLGNTKEGNELSKEAYDHLQNKASKHHDLGGKTDVWDTQPKEIHDEYDAAKNHAATLNYRSYAHGLKPKDNVHPNKTYKADSQPPAKADWDMGKAIVSIYDIAKAMKNRK